MSVRTRMLIVLVVLGVVIGSLVVIAVKKSSHYYVTVTELLASESSPKGAEETVSGMILGKSVVWNPKLEHLTFDIHDAGSSRQVSVSFHGPKPDDFANDWPVVVTGSLEENGTFLASQLLVKCPSKYEASTETFSAVS